MLVCGMGWKRKHVIRIIPIKVDSALLISTALFQNGANQISYSEVKHIHNFESGRRKYLTIVRKTIETNQTIKQTIKQSNQQNKT